MTPAELIATFGPIAGVFLFMWLNRPAAKPPQDDVGKKVLDELESIKSQISAMSADVKVVLDRTPRK